MVKWCFLPEDSERCDKNNAEDSMIRCWIARFRGWVLNMMGREARKSLRGQRVENATFDLAAESHESVRKGLRRCNKPFRHLENTAEPIHAYLSSAYLTTRGRRYLASPETLVGVSACNVATRKMHHHPFNQPLNIPVPCEISYDVQQNPSGPSFSTTSHPEFARKTLQLRP